MPLYDVRGFSKYTPDVVTELRHMFGDGKIESRPIIIKDSVLWLDAEQKLHRENGLPAVERVNGSTEFWTNGKRIF